jgi:hypothetical protein
MLESLFEKRDKEKIKQVRFHNLISRLYFYSGNLVKGNLIDSFLKKSSICITTQIPPFNYSNTRV